LFPPTSMSALSGLTEVVVGREHGAVRGDPP
jgi:hypothetical protein